MAIAFDADSRGLGAAPSSSLTWSHTVSGTDRILIVGMNARSTTTAGVTYNGVAMTLAINKAYITGEVSLWYLSAPSTGANNVIATLAGASTGLQGGGVSLTGVDQTSPIDATNSSSGSSITASVSVTTVADNCWVIDCMGQSSGPASITANGSQTQHWDVTPVSSSCGGSSKGPVSPPASTSMSWTINPSGDWGDTVLSLLPAAIIPPPSSRTSDFFNFFIK